SPKVKDWRATLLLPGSLAVPAKACARGSGKLMRNEIYLGMTFNLISSRSFATTPYRFHNSRGYAESSFGAGRNQAEMRRDIIGCPVKILVPAVANRFALSVALA